MQICIIPLSPHPTHKTVEMLAISDKAAAYHPHNITAKEIDYCETLIL